MPRWWTLVAFAALLAAPARSGEPLSEGFTALSGEVKADGQALAEKVSDTKARRPVVRIISWNLQAFGGNISPEREAAFNDIMGHMLSETRTARILSFQEIANDTGAAKIAGMLPGDGERWRSSFTNTNGAMDNGFFVERSVGTDCERTLFATQDPASGRWSRDREKMMHSPRAAHMRVGNFDFTLVTVHLTFGGANRAGTARELGTLLDWVRDYLSKPGADPDVIITGDFNLPTNSGRTDERGPSVNDVIAAHPVFGRTTPGQPLPAWGIVPLVNEQTSRNDGAPAHNYDHVLMTGDVYNEEYAAGSAGAVPQEFIHSIERQRGVVVSDHYPISAGFYTDGVGNDGRAVAPDGDSACQALMAMAPLSFR